MIENLKYEGDWRLPSGDEWLHGTLLFNPERGGALTIFGNFQGDFLPFRQSKIERVIGRTPMGKITLVDVSYKSFKSDKSFGIITSYDVHLIFNGVHFKSNEDIKFSQVTFSLFNLDSWFNPSNIVVDHNFEKWSFELRAEYQSIENIELGNLFLINIDHDVSLKPTENPEGYSIVKSTQITFNYPQPMIWLNIWKDIICLNAFISFCTNEQSYPTYITLEDARFEENIARTKRLIPVNLYFQTTLFHRGSNYSDYQNHLVPYSLINQNLEKTLTTWHHLYERYSIPINLINSRLKSKRSFNETKFLDATRAVEVFHRIGSDKTKFSSGYYDQLKVTAIQAFSKKREDRIWMEGMLKYANELSLRQRLKNLISKYELEFLFEDKSSKTSFTNEVVVTRNYFTHYDENGRSKAAKNSDLIRITRLLSAIFYCCLSFELGISQSEFRKSLKDKLHQF